MRRDCSTRRPCNDGTTHGTAIVEVDSDQRVLGAAAHLHIEVGDGRLESVEEKRPDGAGLSRVGGMGAGRAVSSQSDDARQGGAGSLELGEGPGAALDQGVDQLRGPVPG